LGASIATDDAPLAGGMTSSAAEVVIAGTCVTSPADDDERSLDENLRPMDGQIWLPDVDGGLTEAFQTVVTTKFALFSVSGLNGEKLIRKQTYMKTETCKLYSRSF